MEVLQPPPPDFNFHSTTSSPYTTAPSSPQLFGHTGHHLYNLSAPSSPTQSSPIGHFFREINRSRRSLSAIPFVWEEKPGVPKHTSAEVNDDVSVDDDFEFEFSGPLDFRVSASADELFDGGRIRPLKPPPRLQVGFGDHESATPSPNASPRTPRSRFSCPKKKSIQRNDFDPFTRALEETRQTEPQFHDRHDRGRGRNTGQSTASNHLRRGTRSLSPLRVSDIILDEEPRKAPYSPSSSSSTQAVNPVDPKPGSYFSSFLSSISFSKGYRKWSFRDFLLFRSASEGRGTSQDPLRKYSALSRKAAAAVAAEDAKSCSFRSTDSAGSSVSGSVGKRRTRRRPSLSAHEVHYTANRAAAEEMRRRTYLPYKQGLLGCLGFNPGVSELARGIGSFRTQDRSI